MKLKILSYILLIGIISSCNPTDNLVLVNLTSNCKCKVSYHFKKSIGIKSKNNTDEFDFINSPIFKIGVPKQNFALSSAILLQDAYSFDNTKRIKINLINDEKTTYYIFDNEELDNFSSDYFKILNLSKNFISSLHNGNYNEVFQLIYHDIDKNKLNNILKKINEKLNYEYKDVKIVGYSFNELEYIIQGGIYDSDRTLNLFNISFIKIDDTLKINSFEF